MAAEAWNHVMLRRADRQIVNDAWKQHSDLILSVQKYRQKMMLRNADMYLPVDTVQHLRIIE